MKKLGVSLLVGLTFAMLLFGCGKEKAEEETVPATEETAESLPVETESETRQRQLLKMCLLKREW